MSIQSNAVRNLDDLHATTLAARNSASDDAISIHSPAFYEMKKFQRVKSFTGGTDISHSSIFKESEGVKYFHGAEDLGTKTNNRSRRVSFPLVQLVDNIQMTGLETTQNAGSAKIRSLYKERLQGCDASMKNTVARSIVSDGTGFGGKELGGFGYLLSSIPTVGVVGGLDRAQPENAFYRNQSYTDADFDSTPLSATNIYKRMSTMIRRSQRNSDSITTFLVNDEVMDLIEDYEQTKGNNRTTIVTGAKEVNMGFESYKIKGRNVYFNEGANGVPAAQRILGINMNSICFTKVPGRYFDFLEKRVSQSQDVWIKYMVMWGNMSLKSPAFTNAVYL